MKRIIGIILLLLVLTNVGYAEEEHATSVQQTTDGGYIIVGIGEDDIKYWTDDDAWMLKTDSNGNKLWNITIDGGYGRNLAYSVQQTSDGGYIIAGEKAEHRDQQLWLLKTDSNGKMEWDKIFENGDLSEAKYVQQTTDGGYIIAGATFSINTDDWNIWLVKTDSKGNKEWDKTFAGTNNYGWDRADSVQQTSDGGYILVGYTYSGPRGAGDSDVWLIKTDSNGNKQWEKTFGGDDSNEGAHSVQQTTDGGYIFGVDTLNLKDNQIYGQYNWNVRIVKTEANGNKQWEKTFGEDVSNRVESVKQTIDGGYVIAGNTEPWGEGAVMDAWLLKTDSNGNTQWEKTFGGEAGNWVESVKQTIDGGYILTGSIDLFDGDDRDVWLAKTDPNGNTQWDKTFKLRDKPAAKDVTTTTSQQNKTTLIFGSIAILIGLVLLVSKSRRKKQGTSRPTSPTPIPTSLPVSHVTQKVVDREQKRMEMQRLAELREDASSKLKRAKGMLNKA
ncbi:MAG: hypothetical protein KAI08_00395, partial [Bacteroidales bacterium]|nr:hypothetical protein [Bacteroidales bacterium]